MKVEEAMEKLRALGDERLRAVNIRRGADENQFGNQSADLRTLAKSIKTDHELALELWATGNADAMRLAILTMRPKQLSDEQLDRMVRSVTDNQVEEWFSSYLVKAHPAKEALRQKWMTSEDPMAARAGWSLTAERVEKSPEGLDLPALLDRIEREMGSAPRATRRGAGGGREAVGANRRGGLGNHLTRAALA